MVTVLAVDDGRFPLQRRGAVLLVGILMEDFSLRKVFISKVKADGHDATSRLLQMVREAKEKIDLIMLPSIACAGFNLIDPIYVYKMLNVSILIVNPRKPNLQAVKQALLHHFRDWKERYEVFKRAGIPEPLSLDAGVVYVKEYGLSKNDAKRVLNELIKYGKVPEPLRVARIIAHELSS